MTKRLNQFLTQNFREYFNPQNNKVKHVSRGRFFLKTNYYNIIINLFLFYLFFLSSNDLHSLVNYDRLI